MWKRPLSNHDWNVFLTLVYGVLPIEEYPMEMVLRGRSLRNPLHIKIGMRIQNHVLESGFPYERLDEVQPESIVEDDINFDTNKAEVR